MPLFFVAFSVLLLVPVFWPQVDLFFSGLFYTQGQGFLLVSHPAFAVLHYLAFYGARFLASTLLLLALLAWALRKRLLLDAKAWLFVFLALVIGPGLVANAGFKDNWGRARPRETTEFGGGEVFSPALSPQFSRTKTNGSFVCGDGAFGFFLPVFAYVVPARRRRIVFWSGMAAGGAFSFARLAMGAHFFSDIIYAAALM
ncbi:MAG: phosphatase PAP2 family protein, partial [Alphaproteobacteria bacterium]|nr:phosphatase PAP2 family protein [Alphaproteobacteria bacterium]